MKLAKSFKYYIRLIPSALSHLTGYMYAVFCLTESCPRYMYVYSSFKWWIFSSVYFLCNHSIPPDSWNLPVQDMNMYMYMYIRKKFPTRNIQDWQQSSMKAGCWGLHVFKLQMKDIHLFLIRSGNPHSNWIKKHHPPPRFVHIIIINLVRLSEWMFT